MPLIIENHPEYFMPLSNWQILNQYLNNFVCLKPDTKNIYGADLDPGRVGRVEQVRYSESQNGDICRIYFLYAMKPLSGIENPDEQTYAHEWVSCDQLLVLKYELENALPLPVGSLAAGSLYDLSSTTNCIPVAEGSFVAITEAVKQTNGQTLEQGHIGRILATNSVEQINVVEFRPDYRPECGYEPLPSEPYALCVIPSSKLLELQFGPELTQEQIYDISRRPYTEEEKREINARLSEMGEYFDSLPDKLG
jgi:hypothetical protein